MVNFLRRGNDPSLGGTMIFVDNEHITDPRINLAIEEHLLRNVQTDQDILLFYINEPSIIIGRNQNTLEEINREVVEARQLNVVRRLSGGGAVYHDLGNLCYSFIMHQGKHDLSDFKKFTAPVVRALNEMGVPAELSGRNDILVEGRKISGNASYSVKQGMVCHGTLLFHSDLEHLTDALKVKPEKITSKGIKSIRSRVANISEFLKEPMDIETFRSCLLKSIFAGADPIPQYHITPADWQAINRLSNERYATWEWNYGHSPEFNIQKTRRFPSGEIDARIDVRDGLVKSIHFYGDFFGQEDVSELESKFTGARYERENLVGILRDIDISQYFQGVSRDELVDFLY
jgi:lipoate---protein ligase